MLSIKPTLSSTAVSNFLDQATKAGCPKDQIENFLNSGYVPQPKQLLFHSAARIADLDDGPDEIGFGGSRGPGKSHALFAQMVLDDCKRFPGLKCLYLRKIGKQAKEQLEDLRLSVLFATPHKYNRHEGIIVLEESRSRVLLGHFKDEKDIESYLGLQYDLIVIEEATTLSIDKYKALRDSNRTSKLGWRPRIYNSTNPGGRGHVWYKKRFVVPWRTQSEKYTRFIPATLDDNKFIDSGYKRRVEENTGWKLKAYRYGDWDIAAGQYFDIWNPEIHILPISYEIQPWWNRFGGYDHGHNHPYVFGAYAVDGDGNVVKYAECGDRGRKPDQIAGEIFKAAPDAKKMSIWAGHDLWTKGRDGSPEIVEQFRPYGLNFIKAHINRKTGADQLRNYLDWRADDEGNIIKPPKFFIKANCVRTIEQLPAMIHDEDDIEDVLKVDATEDDVWAGDDAYDETRYALMSRPRISKEKTDLAGWGTYGWFFEKNKRLEKGLSNGKLRT